MKKAILTLTAFILLSMGSVAFGSDLGEIKEITIRVGNFGKMWVLEYTFDFRNYRKVHGEGNQEVRMELDNLDQNNPKFGVSIESIGFTSPKSIKTAEVLIYRKGTVENISFPTVSQDEKYYRFTYWMFTDRTY